MSETRRRRSGTQLTLPVLAIGGEQSFGATQAVVMRNAATQVTEVVIPHAGHWLMEEQPAATMTAITPSWTPSTEQKRGDRTAAPDRPLPVVGTYEQG